MTEQPPSASKEAMDIAGRIRDPWQPAGYEAGAREIDALIAQRVAAERERWQNRDRQRCEQIDRLQETVQQFQSAQAERPAPPQRHLTGGEREVLHKALLASSTLVHSGDEQARYKQALSAPGGDGFGPPSPAAVVDYDDPKAAKTSEGYRKLMRELSANPDILNRPMVQQMTPIEDSDKAADTREYTCHPDDNPPRPCPRKFAYSECVKAAAVVDYTRPNIRAAKDWYWHHGEGNRPREDEFFIHLARYAAATAPSPAAVGDYTERARELLAGFEGCIDACTMLPCVCAEAIAAEWQSVASEHQSEIAELRAAFQEASDRADEATARLARLREPEVRDALRDTLRDAVFSARREYTLADAALAKITEMLK